MFNRYWRSYPWFIQMMQFVILLAVLFSFFGLGITPVILNSLGVSFEELVNLSEHSPRNLINAALWIQFVTAVGVFLLSAVLFAYFTHPRPIAYLGLNLPKKPLHILLCTLILVAAIPFFVTIAEWMSRINIEEAKRLQEANDRHIKAFLNMQSPLQLFISFFIMAVLAGLCEEIFFRGVIMRLAGKQIKSIVFPIMASAVVFAAMHTNIYGLPSIFIAGVVLGSFYYLTGSLWPGIIAHIFYNGIQVLSVYFADKSEFLKTINETETVPVLWVLVGTFLSVVSFYLLWKTRTPLPENWPQDYNADESAAMEIEKST